MAFQTFFIFIFLLNMGLSFDLGTNVINTEEVSILKEKNVFECSELEEQIGIVEYLPLASGLKVRINAEGKHAATIVNVSTGSKYQWEPKAYDWHHITLEPGLYALGVDVEGYEVIIFKILIQN